MPRLTTTDLFNWLRPAIQAKDPGIDVIRGSIPDMSDRVAVINRTTSGGSAHSGAFERIGFQVRTRGAQNSLDDAEYISLLVDDVMMDELPGQELDNSYITSVQWTGSGPQQLAMSDADMTYEFTCNYIVLASK